MPKKKLRQPKISHTLKVEAGDSADMAVAQWAIAHDIPANALSGPYWKQVNTSLSQVTPTYKPMNPQKLLKDMLPALKVMAGDELKIHLKHAPEAGRTITGDGATKKGTPLLDFLVYVPGKGVALLEVSVCTDHIGEGGVKDAM